MSHIMLFLLWTSTMQALGYDVPTHIIVFLLIISAVIDGVRLAVWFEKK